MILLHPVDFVKIQRMLTTSGQQKQQTPIILLPSSIGEYIVMDGNHRIVESFFSRLPNKEREMFANMKSIDVEVLEKICSCENFINTLDEYRNFHFPQHITHRIIKYDSNLTFIVDKILQKRKEMLEKYKNKVFSLDYCFINNNFFLDMFEVLITDPQTLQEMRKTFLKEIYSLYKKIIKIDKKYKKPSKEYIDSILNLGGEVCLITRQYMNYTNPEEGYNIKPDGKVFYYEGNYSRYIGNIYTDVDVNELIKEADDIEVYYEQGSSLSQESPLGRQRGKGNRRLPRC